MRPACLPLRRNAAALVRSIVSSTLILLALSGCGAGAVAAYAAFAAGAGAVGYACAQEASGGNVPGNAHVAGCE